MKVLGDRRSPQFNCPVSTYPSWIRNIIAAAVVLLFGVACDDGGDKTSAPDAGPKAPLVKAVTPSQLGQSYALYGQGFLKASDQIIVVSELPGIVDMVSPALIAGGRVSEDELLFRLEQRTFIAEKERAEALLSSAVASRKDATNSLQRLLTLEKDNLVSEAQRDKAEVSLAAAKAAEQEAKAALTLADERLQDTEVRAPFDAQVIDESLSRGAFVTPGQKLATIFNVDMAEIVVGLSEDDAAAVMRAVDYAGGERRLKVLVSGDASRRSIVLKEDIAASKQPGEVLGSIRSIAPALDQRSRTVNFIINVPKAFEDEKTPRFLIGDFLNVRFPARASGTLYQVPLGVLRKERYVYAIDAEHTLSRVEVVPVARNENSVLFTQHDSETEAITETTQLLLTSLAEEAEGLEVRVQKNVDASSTGAANE